MTPPTLHGLERTVFWTAFAIWALLELMTAWFHRRRAGARSHDRGTFAVVAGSIWLAFVAAFYATFTFRSSVFLPRSEVRFTVGILLMLLGTALRWYAIPTLGRFFSPTVAIQHDPVVIQSGPYRWVRHPSYSAILLVFLGIGLALGNWLSLAALLAFPMLGLAIRIPVEERALWVALGNSYREYMSRTKRLAPFVF